MNLKTISLKNLISSEVHKYEEIEREIIAAGDENHGVQSLIIKDCVAFPCWRRVNEKNCFVVGLSDDAFDNYWVMFEPAELVFEQNKKYYPYGYYKIRLTSCLTDISKLPDPKDPAPIFPEDILKDFHDQIIKFFHQWSKKDTLLYLAI